MHKTVAAFYAVRLKNVKRFVLCMTIASSLFFIAGITPAFAQGQPGVIGVLHAGRRPEALALDTQTHMLYIAYEAPGMLVGFDPIAGKVRWHAALGDTVTDVQADSNRHRVFAVAITYSAHQSRLFMTDGQSGHTLSTQPAPFGDNSVAFDGHQDLAYTVTPEAGLLTIYRFVSSDGKLLQMAQRHIGVRPTAVAVNSRLQRLYVADSQLNTLTVINETDQRTIATIDIGRFPLPPIRVDEADGRIYVVCSTAQELDVIDGHSNQVIARPAAAPYPEGVAFHTATGRIYVANEGNQEDVNSNVDIGNSITVIDGQSLVSLGTMQVGAAPDGVEADPDLHRVYIALEDSDAVIELIDTPDLVLNTDSMHQSFVAQQTIVLLQRATIVTILLMLATIVFATWYARSPR